MNKLHNTRIALDVTNKTQTDFMLKMAAKYGHG